MTAVYSEIEQFAAQWLRNLVGAGHIADGRVDDRSITEIRADELRGVAQFHAFAGIGVWSHALRLAGWPDDRPVWTGSCPCQPFSSAGRGRGFADDRHLWPVWFDLIRECRPPVVLGEQSASPAGLEWLDLVFADLEGAGYACGAFDLCAAGVGAPHIRQRLYFVAVADTASTGWTGWTGQRGGVREERETAQRDSGDAGSMADPGHQRLGGVGVHVLEGQPRQASAETSGRGPAVRMEYAVRQRRERSPDAGRKAVGRPEYAGPDRGFWSDAEWIACSDGKSRPVEPGTFPLAARAPGDVGKLRAYGNAIVAPLATAFIRSVMDVIG